MKKKKGIRSNAIVASILAVTFVALVIFFLLHCREVNNFNGTVFTAKVSATDSSSASDEADESGDVIASVYFRGGSTDTWVKDTYVRDHLYASLTGDIYELRVTNSSPYTITDWYYRQNIHQDCYINNAWCGTVEIHQFTDGDEKVQTLDLQTAFSSDDLTLNYEYNDDDLLIPLHDGDYIIYYPSTSVSETPIAVHSETTTGVITSGFIYYVWAGGMSNVTGVDLSDGEIHYHYHMDINQGAEYELFLILVMIWAAVCMFFAAIIFTREIDSQKLAKREEFINEALTVFTHFVDAKDTYTKGHSNRVAYYSRMIAEAMGMNEEECKNVYYIALLHDVGKCYIDDKILNKPSRLDRDEFEKIKEHTTLGARMLQDFKSLPDIYDGALYHHERYDGKGYPTGKAGNDIPLIARIICVADSFDAMNSDRVYRKKLSKEVIYSEIAGNKGTQFDPEIADIFLSIMDKGLINFS